MDAGEAVLDDYVPIDGSVRNWAPTTNHQQMGDPTKAAKAIVDVSEAAEQPMRLQLGADCVARVEERLADIHAELDAWRDVAVSTAFDEARA